MGEPQPVSLGYRTNPGRNQQSGNAQLVNCFAEELGEDGKVTIVLHATAGLTDFGSELSGGAIRAMLPVGSTLYAVAGRSVYSVNSSGSSSLLGGIPTDGPVYMARNRRIPAQVGIVSGGLFYVIDTGANELTQVQDPDLPAPVSLSVLDGYGVLPTVDGTFMLTGIDDFTTIDGLDQGTNEAYPDDTVRSMTLEREAVFFGKDSIEWHQNTGDPDFPFERVHSIELGCLAADSVAKVDTPTRKTLIWVAPDHTVRLMNGYQGQTISTPEIESLIEKLHKDGNIAQLRATAWADAGRFFYSLSCDSWTRVWDSKSGQWHTRKSYNLDRWRVGVVVPFGDKLIAGDSVTGQLYEMSDRTFDEAGANLIMEVITPTVHAFPNRLSFNALYIDAATGTGLNSTDAHESAPKLMVDWSDDSGNSWSATRERDLHGLGENFKRIQPVYRMGRTGQKGRQLRFRMSSPVEKLMLQIALDTDQLRA